MTTDTSPRTITSAMAATLDCYIELRLLRSSIVEVRNWRAEGVPKVESEAYRAYTRAIAKLYARVRQLSLEIPNEPCTEPGDFELRALCLESAKNCLVSEAADTK